MAAPFGPPPSCATTRTLPSGVTRESDRRSISTRMTEPSGMATGPSGKRSPEATCLNVGLITAMLSLLSSGVSQQTPHSAMIVTSTRQDGCPCVSARVFATHPGGKFSTQRKLQRSQGLESPRVPHGTPLAAQMDMASKLFRRIVVPTDFSECAEEAWALAQRMASTIDSEVVLVHVFVEPPLYGESPLTPNATWQ